MKKTLFYEISSGLITSVHLSTEGTEFLCPPGTAVLTVDQSQDHEGFCVLEGKLVPVPEDGTDP